MRTDRNRSYYAPSPQLVPRLSAGAPAWGRRITKSLSPEEVRSLSRQRRDTRFLSPSPVACPERSRRAPATGRIFRGPSLEEGRSLPPCGGTRFPGRRDLVAKYVQPRGPRHGEFPAASAGGRRIVKSLSPEEVLCTRFFLRGHLQ